MRPMGKGYARRSRAASVPLPLWTRREPRSGRRPFAIAPPARFLRRFGDVLDESAGGRFPGQPAREVAAGGAVEFQRAETGLPEIFVETSDRRRADNVARRRRRKS